MIKDANILLSIVNTALRDKYSSLSDYANSEGLNADEIVEILASIGYHYDENLNAFKIKLI